MRSPLDRNDMKDLERYLKRRPLTAMGLIAVFSLVTMSVVTGLIFVPISHDKAREVAHHQPGPQGLVPQGVVVVPQKTEQEVVVAKSDGEAAPQQQKQAEPAKKLGPGAEVAHLLKHADEKIAKNKEQAVKRPKWVQPEIPIVPAIPTKAFPVDTYLGKEQPLDYDFSQWTPPGGGRFSEYLHGDSPYEITDELKQQSDALARSRRAHVKQAFKVAWEGYTKHAFGSDDIHPKSEKGADSFDGFGVTLIQSLDLLWMMDMKDEFRKARDWCDTDLTWAKHKVVSIYELTVLNLGGLLSAWEFTKDKVLLAKSYDLGRRLAAAFLMTSSGIPFGETDIVSGNSVPADWDGLIALAILSDFLGLQLEYRFLDYAKKFETTAQMRKKAELMYKFLDDELYMEHGLYPTKVQFTRLHPKFDNKLISMGDMADCAYEYMLKVWLQGNKKEKKIRLLYDRAMHGMHDILLRKSTPTGYTYISTLNDTETLTFMDHRTCAQAGVLALGANFDPLGKDSSRAQRDLRTAKALMYTCYQMNAFTAVGLAPESVEFFEDKDFEVKMGMYNYPLRASTIESLYVLHEVTHDPIYREWAWEIFQSLLKFCRVGAGFGSFPDVKKVNGEPRDRTPVTFFAETLKYFYLIFDPDSDLDIVDKPAYVFNTVGHPLKVFPKKFK